MSDTPRLILERYQLGDVIGKGAFGVVCRAFDTRLKRPVAIKSLKRSMADTDPGHFRCWKIVSPVRRKQARARAATQIS